MLDEDLEKAWRFRERAFPISPQPCFTSDGLTLGAGTILVATEAERRLKNLHGQEARVLALLSAAYGKAITPSVLSNIERAAKAWREGDDGLAYIHLAHARLPEPDNAVEAARRLFMAEGFMEAGAQPRTVFRALALDPAYIEAIEKLYNDAEPRIPPGSGRASGEWTRGGSFLADLTSEAAKQLGRFALGLLPPQVRAAAAVFGILVIPSPNNIRVDGDVPGLPGLKYSWNRDETQIHFTYDNGNGQPRTFSAQLQDDVFRDEKGRVVGRALPDGTVVIDTSAISPDLADDDEPKLCPDPSQDRGGSERGRDYEDYVKKQVNPQNPTPRGMGYALLNPNSGNSVVFDDCQHATGMMVEAKDHYASLLSFDQGRKSVSAQWLDQSARQIAAAGERPIRWYFAEPEAAEFARQLFKESRGGRENIEIVVLTPPWRKQ